MMQFRLKLFAVVMGAKCKQRTWKASLLDLEEAEALARDVIKGIKGRTVEIMQKIDGHFIKVSEV